MKITVVIPLYNKAAHINRAVQSVMNQRHQDFKIIVVDDGSTDDGGQIVQNITDPRIKLISQSNRGVSAARNRGILEAQTDWIAFLDADDEYLPGFLQRTSAFISRHPDFFLVATNFLKSNRSGAVLEGLKEDKIYDYFALFQSQRSPVNSSCAVAKRASILKIGGFPEQMQYFEDWSVWMRLSLRGDFGYIVEPLSIYHVVKNSAAQNVHIDAFHRDAVDLQETIRRELQAGFITPQQRKSASRCMNEIALNWAAAFALYGNRRQAFQLMRLVKLSDGVRWKSVRWIRLLCGICRWKNT